MWWPRNRATSCFIPEDVPRAVRHLDYTLYRSAGYEGLARDNVKAEMAGRVNDFALASLKGVSRSNFFR